MNNPSTPAGPTPATLPRPSSWLRLARAALLSLVAASLIAVFVSLLLAHQHLARNLEAYQPTEFWLPALTQAALAELGWPATSLAWFEYLRILGLYVGFLVPGLLVLRNKSIDWFGLYIGFSFCLLPALGTLDPLVARLPALAPLVLLGEAGSWQLFFILFYVFPDGRFVPGWTRWLLPLWIGFNLMTLPYADATAVPVWLLWAPIPLVLIAVASQVYRYFWRSTPVQRQQTKWVVFAMAVVVVALPVGLAGQAAPSPGQPLGAALVLALARLLVVNLAFALVPPANAMAILRYRLWDIDLIIRRTLIYAVLTGLLALAYVGSVLILQPVFTRLTGQGSTLANVLSTLLIASLFVPFRARVQAAIDRRFFRQKYDAARTLAVFAASARDETDLERLAAQLLGVVDQAMQPQTLQLWLRPRPEDRRAPPCLTSDQIGQGAVPEFWNTSQPGGLG